jgi:hypothetical protein
MISHSALLRLINYDSATGVFTALVQRGCVPAGKVIGSVGNHGYIQFGIEGRMYLGQRVAFFYMTGRWPIEVDHKNRVKTDNRWKNLREASKSQNSFNKPAMSRSKSGIKGVSWNSRRRKWYAFIHDGRKQHYLGSFDDQTEAQSAYADAALKLHGEFARVA